MQYQSPKTFVSKYLSVLVNRDIIEKTIERDNFALFDLKLNMLFLKLTVGLFDRDFRI